MLRGIWVSGVLVLLCSSAMADPDAVQREFFEKRIRPALLEHCYECHSASSTAIEGGLRVDYRDGLLKGGDSGAAVVPHEPAQSQLLSAIKFESLRMPPTGKLPDDVIKDFERWIQQGAYDPRAVPPSASDAADESWKAKLAERRRWWSLQPPQRGEPPAVNDPAWQVEPVDRFIRARLDAAGIPPAPPAEPGDLARRLAFVLTGLPLSPEQTLAFQRQSKVAPEEAYRKLVDELLASPHFGERFARHWMDVIHYTDTYGYEWDVAAKGSWEYRDYLIRAFNQDVGFDQLVREQVAGDLLPTPRVNQDQGINESLIGPMCLHFGERRHGSSLDFAGIHQEMVDSQIDAFSKAFLGLTVACARCHDHKLDAVSQRDYYALAGVFMTPRWTTRSIDLPGKSAGKLAQLRTLRQAIQVGLANNWQRRLTDPGLTYAELVRSGESEKSIESIGYPLQQLFGEVVWTPCRIRAAAAEQADTSLLIEDDATTVRAVGERIPATDRYTVRFQTEPGDVAELRLEALTHPSLGSQGPGRSAHGNFVLSHIRVKVQPTDAAQPQDVVLQSATADYEQPNFPIAAALTPAADGWGVGLGGNVDRTARFKFAEPVRLPQGGEWTVVLEFQLGTEHNLGRFRLSTGKPTNDLALQPDVFRARWERLVGEWKAERDRRRAHNQAFTVLTDFAQPGFPSQFELDGVGATEGWVDEATPLVALTGEQAISTLLPRGYHTHAFSPKLSGAVRLPQPERFPRPFVSLRLAGGEWAGYRSIPQNAFLNEGPAFFDPQRGPVWTSFSPVPVRYGVTRVLSEISTPDLNANFPPRTGVAQIGGVPLPNEDDGYDKRGWFSLTGIIAHDQPGAPLDDLEVFAPLYREPAPASVAEFQQRLREWYLSAVQRLGEQAPAQGDARLLQSLVQRGLLPSTMTAVPELRPLVLDYRQIEAQLSSGRTVNSMDERSVVPVDYRLNIRGDVHQEGAPIARDFLEVFAEQESGVAAAAGSGRLELANYLASGSNPLVARVYVNRVWQWVFGTGIVETSNDFGKLGSPPAHPELLDWLTCQFIEEGWSTKQLVRRMLLSQSFRQSGVTCEAGRTLDPANRWQHHYSTRRLEAEAIRDSILAVSQRLDATLYGRPIRPFRSAIDPLKRLFCGPMDGNGRRSIYLEMSVMQPPEFLVGFNLPSLKIPTGRRDVTNVPTQALTLMNNQFVKDMADHWAERLVADGSPSPTERLSAMFLSAYGRTPSDAETARWLAVAREVAGSDAEVLQSRAAWSVLAHAVFNTKEFLYYR